ASEMVDEPEWYDVLAEVLMGLDAHSIQLDLVQAWFYLRYANLMGHELSLWHDTSGNKLSSEQSYRYDEGEQGLRPAQGGELTTEHIKLLRLIATRPLSVLVQVGGIDDVLPACALVAHEHAAV
ncbi:MAG TPA: DNA repair protein RecO C-terminal domain-containing protein, partial [Candidatus Saccharimonadales bacterium]|nr:DNA repair protein RecO C-terminal domain-containing protein [Candidatus Saccharimonadales bacterium]